MSILDTVDAAALTEEAIRAIADRTLPHDKLVLFGSRARGDARARSDFDLAVFPQTGFADEDLIRFTDALERSSKIIYPLDTVDTRTVSPATLEKIDNEGRVWKN
ncbi:hypothetical protein DDZ13_12770 [Coraliomargarita sinensis]|uniref:Polymerase beta nucleotidyltransferase domain-containing protein n=2 Tax=Coraliomargarita sinensis TaxID=2174842 RepID=A0A317ZIT3_9BACT|nr:hypothetical protein DDZ13_12770 [Coraliomargarita sinensis]